MASGHAMSLFDVKSCWVLSIVVVVGECSRLKY